MALESSPIWSNLCVGLLLTYSSAAGLSYLNRSFKSQITVPPNSSGVHPVFDVINNLRYQWISDLEEGKPGETAAEEEPVLWLMLSLIIELMITPNNHWSKDVPDIQHAYLPIVRDLVSKN